MLMVAMISMGMDGIDDDDDHHHHHHHHRHDYQLQHLRHLLTEGVFKTLCLARAWVGPQHGVSMLVYKYKYNKLKIQILLQIQVQINTDELGPSMVIFR